MASFQFNGAFSNIRDPNYESYGLPRPGGFIGMKPVYQGYESGLLKFPPLTSGMFNELYSTWTAQMETYTQGTLPKLSGYGWQTISAWWGEPLPTGWDGGFAHGVTMTIWKVQRY